jgi:hypothetical protein
MSDAVTVIRTRLVARAELARVLPPDTALISQEERLRQMQVRFNAIQRRYSP